MEFQVGVSLKRFTASSLAVVALAGFAFAAAARADNFEIDPNHTNVEFAVRHMMISNVKGQFEKTTGTITAQGKDPASVQIVATIDASSLNSRVAMRDNDLKSPHFLDVAKYPTITFKSTKVEAAGDGKWKVTGDLTLHGVTKPVVLEVDGPSAEVKSPMGETRVGVSATTKINRSDFGLSWNKTLETGGAMVGDEVAITIDLEAIKK